MATIIPKKNKSGEVVSYKVMVCLGRDEQYKQIWRTCTIKRPEGLTPAKERKEIERQADAWAEDQKAEYERTHSKEDRDKITLADFIKNHWWVDHVMDGTHTPSSISFFGYMSDDIVSYFGQKKRLNQIDAEAVKRYIKFLNTEAKTKQGKPYSATTVQHHFSTLRNILEYARRFHYIQFDPCQDLSQKEKPHRDAKKVDFLDVDKARKFLRCLDEEPLFWKVFMNVLITCGLRRGECVGLQWRDIDSDKLTLNISRSVTLDKNSPDKIRVGNTKTGEDRTVPLSPRLYGLLMELKHEQEAQLQMKLFPSAFIFCRSSDPQRPCYPTEPTRWQRKFVERHDLPNVSPHDLRHTAATLALEAGANLKEVQQLLGHTDPSTTMAFYTGVTEEAQRRTVEGIESLLG